MHICVACIGAPSPQDAHSGRARKPFQRVVVDGTSNPKETNVVVVPRLIEGDSQLARVYGAQEQLKLDSEAERKQRRMQAIRDRLNGKTAQVSVQASSFPCCFDSWKSVFLDA